MATADQTRRRIEQDLHDSAQQRLVSLALHLRAAQAAAGRERSPPRTQDTRPPLPHPRRPAGTCHRGLPDPVEVVGEVLRVAVRDDGCGGADFTGGTGLVGLKDRVEAIGGRIFLDRPPGAGTGLRVELPITAANGDITIPDVRLAANARSTASWI